MKQQKKPTREQKEIISKNGLVVENWMVVEDSKTELEVVSKRSGQRRILEKEKRRK